MVVNIVVAPRYARLWKEGNIERIQYLAKWSTRGMIAMVLPIVAVIVIWPEKVMGLLGEGFEEAAVLLMILAVGQFVNVATGSVGYLLNMSGHERDFNRVTLATGPLTIVLAFTLTMKFGVIGAVLATSVGLSIQNLVAMALVKRRLGFYALR